MVLLPITLVLNLLTVIESPGTLEQFFGIAYQSSGFRPLTHLARSGLAASVSFHQVKFGIFTHGTHVEQILFFHLTP